MALFGLKNSKIHTEEGRIPNRMIQQIFSFLYSSGERRLRRSSGCIPSRSSGRQLAGVKKKQVPPRFETALAFVWIWLH